MNFGSQSGLHDAWIAELLLHAGYVKYAGAIPAQVGTMTGALWALQQLCNALTSGAISLPLDMSAADTDKALVTLFFLVVGCTSKKAPKTGCKSAISGAERTS